MRPTPRAEEAEAGSESEPPYAAASPRLGVQLACGAVMGLCAGAAGGVLAGLLETVLGWAGAQQYLASGGARLRMGLFLCSLEGFFGALVGCIAFAVGTLLWRATALPGFLRRTVEGTGAGRRLSWLVALLLALVLLGVATSELVLYAELHFHDRALIAKLVGLLAPVGVFLAAAVAFALEPLLRLAARAIPGTGRRSAPLIALAALLAALGTVLVLANRETVRVLDLRPLWAILAFGAGTLLYALGVLPRLPHIARRFLRFAAPVALLGTLLVLTIGTGSSPGVRKAAALHTAFGGSLTQALRSVADFDRDGYSSILGGGDCNDFDADVHPGAFDWPDNGKDENCSGTDATARAEPPAPFVAVPPAVPPSPNILLVTIDTLRADHLGLYGYGRPTSPNLDALGATSVVFEHGYAHAPSTRYSMPVILTGRYASQVAWDSACPFTGGCATRWPPPLAESNVLIAEILKKWGYYTAALLNYRFFEPGAGYNQGFDLYDNGRANLHQGPTDPATHGSSSREQAEAAMAFLHAHAHDKWFLWLHFYDPHYYYEQHAEVPSFGTSELDRYDGEIRFTDLHLGRVLGALGELGLREKTIIVVTGDHGEGFGEHGIEHHGYHLYNAQTQVPMILSVPGIAARRVAEPIGHVDLLPTLLNLIRAQPEPTLVGKTAVDWMTGGGGERHLFQEVMYEGPVTRKTIVTRQWKLIWNVEPDNSFELYHIEDDPGELHDVWADPQTQAQGAALRRALSAWVERSTLPPGFAEKIAPAISEQAPSPALPLRAELGDAIELLGCDLGSATVPRGGQLDITYFWHAKRALRGPWRPFVHIEGAGGVWLNADHTPVEGLWPIDHWHAGQYIRDHQRIPLPPTAQGELTVWVGLYAGGRRMPVSGNAPTDGANRIRLATVHVAP